jgi:hypothetical protein
MVRGRPFARMLEGDGLLGPADQSQQFAHLKGGRRCQLPKLDVAGSSPVSPLHINRLISLELDDFLKV